MRVATIFLLGAAFFLSGISVAKVPSAEVQYRATFLAYVTHAFTVTLVDSPSLKGLASSERKARISQAANTATDCYMAAMNEYSPELRDVAYAVVQKGGSFLESKGAFDLALAKEGAAGGEREEKVKKMILRAVEVSKPCLAKINV